MPSFQVTLTTAATNYELLALVRVIDSAYVDLGDVVVQADDDGGAQVFLLGDSHLGTTRYGQLMHAGDFTQHFKSVGGLYARCDTDGKKMNIMVAR